MDNWFITESVSRSAESETDRRRLAALVDPGVCKADPAGGGAPSDAAILNFALNLEYLEAEFYLRATTGSGLPDEMTTGTGERGEVSGGGSVNFNSKFVQRFAKEIASDEKQHVAFLRAALGNAAVARPAISLDTSFTAAATAAGLIKQGESFDPYANDLNFLFAAFLFEDVGVSAFKGSASLLSNKTYLDAAAGLLATEAYHAGIVRSALYSVGLTDDTVFDSVQKLSDARNSLDGPTDDDQGVGTAADPNFIPTDENGMCYGRSAQSVLNIVYLSPTATASGGFYPAGLNGEVVMSAGAA
ncbi:ferritin-like domain-containing protein [Micromonospora azadirachtae]|uniref:Ferritin-like domain-containing protein n=1 Tax=Micromonospora azadirachtae TaxID=1970735 RepID=A0ABW2ZXS8_9ACTN